MDFMSTAQLLGNVGEFVGAIAVVATLGYLAIQIRQNTKATRAQTAQDLTGSMSEYLLVQAQSDVLGAAWSKAYSDSGYGSLDIKDAFHIRGFVVALLNTYKNSYDQWQFGTITEREWNEYRELLVALFRQYELVDEIWDAYKHLFSKPFVEAVDEAVEFRQS